MNRARTLAVLFVITALAAGCTTTTPATHTASSSSAAPTLASTAAHAGCKKFKQSSTAAPYVAKWGTCKFKKTSVSAYEFANESDYKSFMKTVATYGIVESQTARVGNYLFAPEDQTKLAALTKALNK